MSGLVRTRRVREIRVVSMKILDVDVIGVGTWLNTAHKGADDG